MSERLRTVLVMAVTVVVAALGLEFLPSSPLHGTFRGQVYRLHTEVTAQTHGPHDWVMTQPGRPGTPVTYDPCRPIEVVVNPDGGPTLATDLVRISLERVNEVTGLDLRYAGASDERPEWDDRRHPATRSAADEPVLVSWATAQEVPELGGDVAGIAASVAQADHAGRLTFVTGQVTLDSDAFQELAAVPDSRARMRAVVLHELGHLVGLAHVRDRHELMNEKLEVLDFGPGDLEGLARLGKGRCT